MEWDEIQAAVEPPDIAVIHSCNENCPYFTGCPIDGFEEVGLCSDHLGDDGWVTRQEDGEGDCVW